jgi:hypothetical protein
MSLAEVTVGVSSKEDEWVEYSRENERDPDNCLRFSRLPRISWENYNVVIVVILWIYNLASARRVSTRNTG